MSQKLIKYGYKTPMGKTIRELIWEQLDDAMDKLMEGKPRSFDGVDPKDYGPGSARVLAEFCEQYHKYGREQGIAEATAYIIALFEQPEHPDIISVKGAAVLRYKEKQHLLELRTMEDQIDAKEDGESSPGPDVGGESVVTADAGDPDNGQASEG